MVDQHAHPGRLQKRRHFDQLVRFYLYIGEHIEAREIVQQRLGVTEGLDAEQGGLHRGADHAAIAQPLQFVAAGVVFDHSHTLEPAVPALEQVEQASVVCVVSRVGTHHQRMSGSVCIEQVDQLARSALLIIDRVVPGVGCIPEMGGIEKVVVTVDLWCVVDRHDVSLRHGADGNRPREFRSR